MAVIMLVLVLLLNLQGCLCSDGQTQIGCKKWRPQGDDVCCDICYPGNRLVTECGPNPASLCKPCESGTYTTNPKNKACTRCSGCAGDKFHLENCTTTTDTKCGCKKGFRCGDDRCSYCEEECGKGFEPISRRCRQCPEGTFNDKVHQKCKSWSTKCPNPNQTIVSNGTAHSDIKCNGFVVTPVVPVDSVKKPDDSERARSLISTFTRMVLMGLCVIVVITIIIIVIIILIRNKKKTFVPTKQTPRIPKDDPESLIPEECSFHEAQQEQGHSLESLNSKDSQNQLIP
ncbi:tumor necrosis factor receptor superfamily member 9a [Pholidichthys leucotaenia]